jgi:hypothetical protein
MAWARILFSFHYSHWVLTMGKLWTWSAFIVRYPGRTIRRRIVRPGYMSTIHAHISFSSQQDHVHTIPSMSFAHFPYYHSSSSSCPLCLAPVGANHLRDQIFPCPPILHKVEQVMSTALTPFCYVIQPFSAWTSPSRFSIHFTKY